MEIDKLFGLPAHPLIVHAAVVLLPLAAIGVVVVAALPRARRHYAPVVLGVALAATLAVGLAQGSGESLEENVDETELVEAHTSKGESVLPWAIGVTIAAAAVTAADPVRRRFDLQKPDAKVVTAGLVAVGLITGIGATWTVIDVGHSGAKAAWDEDADAGSGSGKDTSGTADDHGDDDDDESLAPVRVAETSPSSSPSAAH